MSVIYLYFAMLVLRRTRRRDVLAQGQAIASRSRWYR